MLQILRNTCKRTETRYKCFCAPKNSVDRLSIPQELATDMFAYLIQTKLLTKESLSLILSSGSITSFSLERYFTLKEDALAQIALCHTLQVLLLNKYKC